MEIDNETKRELYFKARDVIRHAKLHKYFIEKDIISEEGLTFFGNFTGKNALLYERIRNVKLRIELVYTERVESKNDYRILDTLAEINSCALNEFSGHKTPEMEKLYNDIKNNYCDDSITDEDIYILSCQKADKLENFLPVVHEEKKKGIFGDRRVQIAYYRIENQKLEDLIIKQRGKMQLETFSDKAYAVIVPSEKTIKNN